MSDNQDQSWLQRNAGTIAAGAGEVANAYLNNQGMQAQADAYRQGRQAYQNAAQGAIGTQRDVLNQQMGGLAPWISAGLTSLPYMTQMAQQGLGQIDPTQNPGYQFRMQEGMKGVENSLAARGLSGSGKAMKALTRYGQDYASNEYDNAWRRQLAENQNQWGQLAGLGNLGYGAQSAQTNALGSYGSNVGNTMLQSGEMAANALANIGGTRASSYQGYGNALLNTGMSVADQMMMSGISPEDYVRLTRGRD
jgi:hypothetical protein